MRCSAQRQEELPLQQSGRWRKEGGGREGQREGEKWGIRVLLPVAGGAYHTESRSTRAVKVSMTAVLVWFWLSGYPLSMKVPDSLTNSCGSGACMSPC